MNSAVHPVHRQRIMWSIWASFMASADIETGEDAIGDAESEAIAEALEDVS